LYQVGLPNDVPGAQIQIYKEHVLGVKKNLFEQDTYIGDLNGLQQSA
jgi:hypothetical protein